jgi:hypothetical protein
MSGGFFDHRNYCLVDIADSIENHINNNVNKVKDSFGNEPPLEPEEIIHMLRSVVKRCRKLERDLHVVDYYLSGDSGRYNMIEHFLVNKLKRGKKCPTQ